MIKAVNYPAATFVGPSWFGAKRVDSHSAAIEKGVVETDKEADGSLFESIWGRRRERKRKRQREVEQDQLALVSCFEPVWSIEKTVGGLRRNQVNGLLMRELEQIANGPNGGKEQAEFAWILV